MEAENKKRICYFGIYKPDFSRNSIFRYGLELNDVEVLDCNDNSKGLKKFWNLWKKHKELEGKYDVLFVGFPGQIITPFAKVISRKKVILDALCSLYEGEIISRESSKRLSLRAFYIWCIDFFAYLFADLVLVESLAQKEFFERKFFVNKNKCKVIYTGADSRLFFPDKTIEKRKEFTVLFRGKFLPEAGVDIVIKTAKILEDKGVKFLLLGNGLLEKEVSNLISELKPSNLDWNKNILAYDEMRKFMLSCHLSLGQLSHHDRLKRTIPHKAYESIALALPYLTAKTGGVSEIFSDNENVFMFKPDDPKELVIKILNLKENTLELNRVSENGYKLFLNNFSPKVLGKKLKDLLF